MTPGIFDFLWVLPTGESVLQVEENKRVAMLQALIESGLFTMKNGSLTLHYDHQGNLTGIKKDQWTFKR